MANTKKAADEPEKALAQTAKPTEAAAQIAPAPSEDDDEDYASEASLKRLQGRVRQLEKDMARVLEAVRFRLPRE